MAFQTKLGGALRGAMGRAPGAGAVGDAAQSARGAVQNRIQGDMNNMREASPLMRNSPLLNKSPLLGHIADRFGMGGGDKVQKGLGPTKPGLEAAMEATPPPPGMIPAPPDMQGGMGDQLAAQQALGPVMNQPPPMPPDVGPMGGLGPQAPQQMVQKNLGMAGRQNMINQKRGMM